MKNKWIAVGSLSVLGLGAIAASAAGVANAVELRDAEGSVVQISHVRGDLLERGTVAIATTDDQASIVSANTAPSAQSAQSTQSAQSAPSAQSVPSAPSAQSPVSAPTADSPVSAQSAVSNA